MSFFCLVWMCILLVWCLAYIVLQTCLLDFSTHVFKLTWMPNCDDDDDEDDDEDPFGSSDSSELDSQSSSCSLRSVHTWGLKMIWNENYLLIFSKTNKYERNAVTFERKIRHFSYWNSNFIENSPFFLAFKILYLNFHLKNFWWAPSRVFSFSYPIHRSIQPLLTTKTTILSFK